MNKFIYTKSFSSLKHLQVVTLIISLSVFFSAAVLMALISLSSSFKDILIDRPEEKFGANVIIETDPAKAQSIIDTTETAKQNGNINNYTEITQSNFSKIMKGKKQIFADVTGVWDNKYPLEGDIKLVGTSSELQSKLKDENDILISKEAADNLGVKTADTINYVTSDYLNIYKLKIVGLIDEMPNRSTSQIIMKGSTLQKIEPYNARQIFITGNEATIKSNITSGQHGNINYVKTLSEYNKQQDGSTKKLNAFLRGMGILGLFIGSLGIASSIQVIINRRKNEIAILKIIGYRKSQITQMFVFELTLIALGGSFIGTAVGYIFCRYLISILSTLGMTYSFDLSFDLKAGAIAISSSVFSAILFSLITINNYTSLKPMEVLKDMKTRRTWKARLLNLISFAFIGSIFIILSIAITSSVPIGVGAVLLVFVGVVVSRILIQILFRLVLFIPVKTHNVLELSWLNLKSSYKQYSLAGMAIFIGLTVLALLITLMNAATFKFDENTIEINRDINIVSYRQNTNDSQIKNIVSNNSTNAKTYRKLRTEGKMATDEQQSYNRMIEGRDPKNYSWDIKLVSGEFKSGGIIVPSNYNESYKIGSVIKYQKDNKNYSLPITGFYEQNESFSDQNIEPGSYTDSMIITEEDFLMAFNNNYQEVTLIAAPKNDITKTADEISKLNNTIVIDTVSLEKELNSQISLLKQFLFSLSGLALVSGIILIINATSLEVFNRKRSFAIYKTIGFSSKKVRLMLALEYALMLFITSALSILTSFGVIKLFNQFSEQLIGTKEELAYSFGSVAGLALISSLLILSLVMSVSYRTLNTKPNEVLRYE